MEVKAEGKGVFALLAHRKPDDSVAFCIQQHAVLTLVVNVGRRNRKGFERRASAGRENAAC